MLTYLYIVAVDLVVSIVKEPARMTYNGVPLQPVHRAAFLGNVTWLAKHKSSYYRESSSPALLDSAPTYRRWYCSAACAGVQLQTERRKIGGAGGADGGDAHNSTSQE
jgi:hypothetical protein